MACDDKNVAIGSTMKSNLGNSQTRYLEKVVTLLKLLILGGGWGGYIPLPTVLASIVSMSYPKFKMLFFIFPSAMVFLSCF